MHELIWRRSCAVTGLGLRYRLLRWSRLFLYRNSCWQGTIMPGPHCTYRCDRATKLSNYWSNDLTPKNLIYDNLMALTEVFIWYFVRVPNFYWCFRWKFSWFSHRVSHRGQRVSDLVVRTDLGRFEMLGIEVFFVHFPTIFTVRVLSLLRWSVSFTAATYLRWTTITTRHKSISQSYQGTYLGLLSSEPRRRWSRRRFLTINFFFMPSRWKIVKPGQIGMFKNLRNFHLVA